MYNSIKKNYLFYRGNTYKQQLINYSFFIIDIANSTEQTTVSTKV